MIPIVAIQMNALETIQVTTDTTFAFALEAQKRGYQIFVFEPSDLLYVDHGLQARGRFVFLQDNPENHFKVIETKTLTLEQASYVLIRQDPPFDLGYITTTHLLELLPKTTRVINDPIGIRNAPEKLLVTHFPSLTPPTLISRHVADVEAFVEHHGTCVLKPLFEFGGQGVVQLQKNDVNLKSLVELYRSIYKEPFIVQKFIPEISEGDKRILLIQGEPVGVFKRVPQENQILSNMRVGGLPQPCDYTARDLEICATIGPVLRQMGLIFAGIDVIGDYLTEINVTSPTGLRVIDRLYGLDLAKDFWDAVEG